MKKAFTLLEMLIVLGIIAVILSVLTVSFSTAQKKSRDARRKGDLKAMQNALEQYYSACNYTYPTGSSIVPTLGCASMAGVNFLPTVPADPKTAAAYSYSSDGNGFTVCANSIETESITGFCVKSQQ